MSTIEEEPAAGVDERSGASRGVRRELFSDELIDRLLDRVEEDGLALTGPGGFLPEMLKSVLERGMARELTAHLGYEHGQRSTGANTRNGTSPETVSTEVGDVRLDQPRDRAGTFSPALVPKGERHLGGLDAMIISLYAGGMTVRDIQHHLAATIGTELSHETISNVTETIADEVAAWQSRPLEAFYPVVYLDALVVKVRDGGHVSNRAAHIAVGVDMDGAKHVLGIWVQSAEGAKFWAGVCANLANRGVKDVLIVCCDGLAGLPEAIEATWSRATVQTCTVHLIRASMRFVAYHDRKPVAAALRPVYTAPDEDAALQALTAFADSALGKKYPATAATWEAAWERFTPFLAFGPALRRIIYTTNAIVISSPPNSVLDVRQGRSGCFERRRGRGYLRCVHHGTGWRADVGAEGDHARVSGRIVDGARRRRRPRRPA